MEKPSVMLPFMGPMTSHSPPSRSRPMPWPLAMVGARPERSMEKPPVMLRFTGSAMLVFGSSGACS
eukprot:15478281-Alexandrium_andersonii.AAC.1